MTIIKTKDSSFDAKKFIHIKGWSPHEGNVKLDTVQYWARNVNTENIYAGQIEEDKSMVVVNWSG